MERKISFPLYATAFIISLIIFLAGVFVGTLLDSASISDISEEISDVSQQVSSVQLLLLMEGNSSTFCPVYFSELSSIDEDVQNFGYRLSYLEEEKGVQDIDLKMQYFVLEAESYLLSEKVKKLCGGQSILLIHFYSNTKCDDCQQQGIEILRARDESNISMRLFSFDGEIGSPVAKAFMDRYNITTYPSIVINGKTYAGYHTADELKAIISGANDS
ncbi:conjugal transfer protein TraF [Candidatus Micrarchaeota archaeon]|nr:conjugal transfer protein TraF [Candidatus Micrarchaeota archaeon]